MLFRSPRPAQQQAAEVVKVELLYWKARFWSGPAVNLFSRFGKSTAHPTRAGTGGIRFGDGVDTRYQPGEDLARPGVILITSAAQDRLGSSGGLVDHQSVGAEHRGKCR